MNHYVKVLNAIPHLSISALIALCINKNIISIFTFQNKTTSSHIMGGSSPDSGEEKERRGRSRSRSRDKDETRKRRHDSSDSDQDKEKEQRKQSKNGDRSRSRSTERRKRSRSRSPERRRRSRSRSGSRDRRVSPERAKRRDDRRSRSRSRGRDRRSRSRDRDAGRRRDRDGSRDKGKEAEKEKGAAAEPRKKKDELLTTKTGGAYIPPAKLRMMQKNITDKSSEAYQRLAWEALKKSINGLINKVNSPNIAVIVRELFAENIVRGRGLLCQSIIQVNRDTFDG